jgi:3-oxoacyl-[acyl-carrier-protein] synthase II
VTPRAVTGFGVASALGVGREAFLASYPEAGRASGGDRRVETFDVSPYAKTTVARVAEVPDFDATKHLGDKGLRSLDRLAKLLVVASRLALHDAGLKRAGAWTPAPLPWPERLGVVVSNAYGSLEAITELDRVAVLEDARYINPSRFPLTVSNSAAGYVSIWEDLRAVNVSVSDGNCGALDAVACADVLLDQARADVLLVGGAEAMSEALFLAFHRLGALGSGSSTEGPCLGEGAALLALERSSAAAARSASVLAEVIGYGTSFAPPEREGALVHATPVALEAAIGGALADAGIEPRDVDLVVSGVSGLRVFDEAELLAIERTVGDHATVVAPKLVLGETLGAGGAMGMLAAIAHLQAASPSSGSSSSRGSSGSPSNGTGSSRGSSGSPSNATWVRGPVRTVVRTALVTSVGYYGNASALVMRAASR